MSRKGRKRSQDVSARRRRAQEKSRIPWAYVIPALLIVAVVAGALYVSSHSGSPTGLTTTQSGNGQFPFPCLANEQLIFHIHPWLRIVIGGENVTIPAGIGIQNPQFSSSGYVGSGSCFEPIHTHDSSGIIHIESPTETNYTLGQFFQIWAASYADANISGVVHPIVYNSTDILGFNQDSTHKIVLLVDGQPSSAGPSLVLDTLDYCNSSNSASPSSPCYVSAQGNPSWNGGTSDYPYGTGHNVSIQYETV